MSAFIWDTVCWAGMKIWASRDRYLSTGHFDPPRILNWPKSPHRLGLREICRYVYVCLQFFTFPESISPIHVGESTLYLDKIHKKVVSQIHIIFLALFIKSTILCSFCPHIFEGSEITHKVGALTPDEKRPFFFILAQIFPLCLFSAKSTVKHLTQFFFDTVPWASVGG